MAHQMRVEMFQKGNVQSVFVQPSAPRPSSQATDMYDTEFEEDLSDFEEYSGRRSEESFGNRSNTTVSTFEEIQTPALTDYKGFDFQLQLKQEKQGPTKPVEGPTGPHLFRISQDSARTQEHDIYLDWSPVLPQDLGAGPKPMTTTERQQKAEVVPESSVPLQAWTPQQVGCWMTAIGLESSLVQKFRMHDISGAILKELQFGDLKELGIVSFGQRHQLWDAIRNLRGGLGVPSTPAEDPCYSPISPNALATPQQPIGHRRADDCSNPSSPDDDKTKSPTAGRRRARRAVRPDDVISPGESASIVAIEQLLPEPHHCSKGENCSKYKRYQRKMAKFAKEFPMELEQYQDANTAPSEVNIRPMSEAVPSVVASSDLLGPGRLPALRLDEHLLRVVKTRDPQENVRQFLSFQHLDEPAEEPSTSPYEMFPPLSPPGLTQAPHSNLSLLPKLTIPTTQPHDALSPNRTAVPLRQNYTPVTALYTKNYNNGSDIFRLGSPASAMDVPVTAIPLGPIERDASHSVPPSMRFGGEPPMSRSNSRADHRQQFSPVDRRQALSPIPRPQTANPIERSTSHRHQPSFAMAPLRETLHSPIDCRDDLTPTANDVNHAGWMKKRKTKMLRHEWHENHFRLNGTRLAMHRDEKVKDALEYIDVDEYAVACSSLASNKLNAAFKSLKLSSKKKDGNDSSAFSFQLVPAAEKKGILGAATGRTHHFAVKSRDERIDWMRELMLAKARQQKADGCEINVNGNMI
ncbi:MAG: hypothetical protein ALECFALPRED_001040 [Alectoria fallacina]|uniref:Uncharacterized protein n=1 Tax=Alectoria fallacina TaxID=1903189 RepID=A0A8H3I380_9LECA|nr:MAG: hypothetical protein ALECFALPRED_001040 [Alectoria fallacina]